MRDMVAALSPAAPVTSVAGRVGTVTLGKTDVGLANVTDDVQIRADFGYSVKAAPASGDKLIIRDQTDGQPKIVDWNQLASGTASVSSVYGRGGAVVAQAGDYTAEQITDTPNKVLMTATERTKLTGIAAGAQVNPIRVTAAEKTAATSVTVRGFAPADVRDMVAALAPAAAVSSVAGRTGAVVLSKADVGLPTVTNDPQLRADLGYATKGVPAAGDKLVIKDQSDGQPKLIDWNQLPTGSVTSVYGRTGPVVAQAGDYTADQIAETAAKVLMTVAERTRLAGMENGAQANPPSITDAEKALPSQTTTFRSFSPKDIADLVASIAATSVHVVDGGSATTVFAGAAA
ncbi:MAG: hypothetical protein IPK78_06745 [Rhodospirillales bacterium]|nr:hypothetical protein [Rhodospirillales bacterium]